MEMRPGMEWAMRSQPGPPPPAATFPPPPAHPAQQMQHYPMMPHRMMPPQNQPVYNPTMIPPPPHQHYMGPHPPIRNPYRQHMQQPGPPLRASPVISASGEQVVSAVPNPSFSSLQNMEQQMLQGGHPHGAVPPSSYPSNTGYSVPSPQVAPSNVPHSTSQQPLGNSPKPYVSITITILCIK